MKPPGTTVWSTWYSTTATTATARRPSSDARRPAGACVGAVVVSVTSLGTPDRRPADRSTSDRAYWIGSSRPQARLTGFSGQLREASLEQPLLDVVVHERERPAVG